MARLVLLGTSAALPTATRDNVALAWAESGTVLLVDCPGSPYPKLLRAGLAPAAVAALVVTHAHADHIYGLPILLQSLWLSGRQAPLPIYALPEAIPILQRLVDAFRPESWHDAFPLEWRTIDPDTQAPFLALGPFTVRAARGNHSLPSAALRCESASGGSCVYSADTRPSPAVLELARGADILVHEATFDEVEAERAERVGHSTAAGAARLAAAAGAKRLLLVHTSPANDAAARRLEAEARAHFPGEVAVPDDLASYQF